MDCVDHVCNALDHFYEIGNVLGFSLLYEQPAMCSKSAVRKAGWKKNQFENRFDSASNSKVTVPRAFWWFNPSGIANSLISKQVTFWIDNTLCTGNKANTNQHNLTEFHHSTQPDLFPLHCGALSTVVLAKWAHIQVAMRRHYWVCYLQVRGV